MKELEFATWINFWGERTSHVRYPEISEVGEASSWDPRRSRSGIGELYYLYIPLD